MSYDLYHSTWIWLTALGFSFSLGACAAPTRTEVEVVAETLNVTNEGIVLFPDSEFSQCLSLQLETGVTSKPHIMDTAAFKNSMFPWFESEDAIRKAGGLRSLLSRPLVRKRIGSLNIRYLIGISGHTVDDDESG